MTNPAKASRTRGMYKEITIDGEPCYQKFRAPESIKIVVAGGTAGKFSAVIGSWSAGPRGSQMVTYPMLSHYVDHSCKSMNERALSATAAPRLPTLAGKTIALLDISKPGGSVFLDRLERILLERYARLSRVIREMKPTFAKPAPEAMLEQLRGVDAVIEALAD